MTQDYGAVPPNISAPAGLYYVGPSTVINLTLINAVIAAGWAGIFLDPRYVYTLSGTLVLKDMQNFTIESRMTGYIGWLGAFGPPSGYIATGSTADGVQVYATNPSVTNCSGIVFRGLAFVGANTNAVIHMGGGQRDIRFENVYIENTNSTAGAFAFIGDTQLADYNGENQSFFCVDAVGAYAAVGMGINDQTQRFNDSQWHDLRTSGGSYGIYIKNGGNQTFTNWYDRSGESVASYYQAQGSHTIAFGETLNSTALNMQLAGGTLRVISRQDTGIQASISSGTLEFISGQATGGNFTLTGGTVNIYPAYDASPITMLGSAGTVNFFGPSAHGQPTVSSYTGTYNIYGFPYPSVVGKLRWPAGTTTQTLTITTNGTTGNVYRVSLYARVTAAGTSTIPTITYTDDGGNSISAAQFHVQIIDAAYAAPVDSIVGTGKYYGQATFEVSSTAGNLTLTVTPTGSTFAGYIAIEMIN